MISQQRQERAGRTKSPQVVVYCGNDPDEILKFERWLGGKVDGVLGYTGGADWADYDGSVPWAVGLWGKIDRRIFWSVPLIPKGATLEAAARGDYDDHYRKAAGHLRGFRPGDGRLNIRTGWEFNGDWMPWTAQKNPKAFAGAFRHFVRSFHSVSDRFLFEWNVNVGDVGMNPEDAYPGDEYVDLVGMDFYWQLKWDPKEPGKAWDNALTRRYGLEWHQKFAAAHRKPTSYSEWGISADNAAPYLEKAKQWFDRHDVVFHTYWDSNADYPGKLSDGQYPAAAAAYRRLFGTPGRDSNGSSR
jgi:hypothetical protein